MHVRAHTCSLRAVYLHLPYLLASKFLQEPQLSLDGAVALKAAAEASEKNLSDEIASIGNKLTSERCCLQQQQQECSRLWTENRELRHEYEQGMKDLRVCTPTARLESAALACL